MNTINTSTARILRTLVQPVVAAAARSPRRERDFGVGYGRSSGYAADKRYVRDWGNARFRVA